MIKKQSLKAAVLGLTLLASAQVLALRSTKVEGHTDPDYIGYQPKKVVLVVMGASTDMRQQIDERMTKALAEYGVQVFTERQVFPPTRQWTPEQMVEILQRQGFDSSIILAVGANSSQIIPVARQTYGSANTTGYVNPNGSFSANSTGQSTSYNIVSAKSSAEFSAVLVEIGSGKTAWYGDIVTKAGGTLFVGAKGDAKASVKGVIEGLEEDGHILKPARRGK